MKFLLSALAAFALVENVDGHGYMSEPLSRNYNAQLFGLDWGNQPNVPAKEYCFHCLNTKGPGSVCGTSESGVNYDNWLDSNGEPISWNSNGSIYGEGDIITINSFLTAHHTGHMEARACPMGRGSTQECFDANVLEFVEDLAYSMPKDEDHPERGYYYGSSDFNNEGFSMRFKLPEGLVGEEVLLQWWYITANSCYPPGYDGYYAANSFLPKDFYNSVTEECTPEQYTPEFYTGEWPERFVNCAEITIVSENGVVPNDPPVVPTDAPVSPTDAPVSPTDAPVSPPTEPPVPIISDPIISDPVTTPEDDNNNDNNNSNNNENGDGCCSNDYRTCATWCQSRGDCLEAPYCTNMQWLENGALPANAICEGRWGSCSNENSCCEGLVCKQITQYYSQCLAPGE